ncbi:MAG: bifunctional 2-polyprenyl-6-hydroxyphenol methylase/3-demethylubiquinol 3-O-methyltransferase UbiG, partial [Alphaproteobacteria bacterium]
MAETVTTSATTTPETNVDTTIDPAEIAKFEAMAADWWDPRSNFRPLHIINPVRIAFIKEIVCAQFDRDTNSATPFSGLRFLDIGCGGGILSEPVTRLGADLVGVDPSQTNIEVARLHAASSGLAIDYRATTAEALAAAGETFDVILNMEVVEHVADVEAYITACTAMVRPGGLMIASTINRTRKAWALAIVAAERILRWLPAGTHDYDKLVTPNELEAALASGNMTVTTRTGIRFNPLTGNWRR